MKKKNERIKKKKELLLFLNFEGVDGLLLFRTKRKKEIHSK